MPKKIQKDQQQYRKIISGKFRKNLSKLIDSGGFTALRPDGKGRIIVPHPKINTPHFVYGENNQGIGRGSGKKGTVIKKDSPDGESGSGGGRGNGEYINVAIELEDFLAFMQNELNLPDMKPKPSQTYEEVKKRWNNLSKVGPRSLRHVRQTIKQAMKRLASIGELDKLHSLPGNNQLVPMIEIINDDFRYRQYTEKKIPSSDAVILFARDGSGSMDKFRCEVVSDMAWWINCWLSRYYKRVQKCFFIHTSEAQEVDEKSFYSMRSEGGTEASCVFKKMAETFEDRFLPSKYNIYVMYFSDGDNWSQDNDLLLQIIEEQFNKNIVNLIGYGQVYTYNYSNSMKNLFDSKFKNKDSLVNLVSASVGAETSNGWGTPVPSEEERSKSILEAIKTILGAKTSVLDV